MSSHNFFYEAGRAESRSGGQIGDPAVLAWGDTVPSDSDSGYAKNCIFIHTDGTPVDDSIYLNVGSESSCDFDALDLTKA